MNTINIYLKTSGSVAEIQKEFTLYTGSYQNTLVDVYVPTSILYSNEQNTYVNEIKIGGSSTAPNGETITTNPYRLNYVKVVNIEDGEVNDVPAGEYKVFETLLPKEFCVNPGTQVVSINVVSIDNTDTENPVLLGITTTQRCDLLVVASDLYEMGGETPDQLDILVATVENHGERITNLESDVSDIQGDIATINDEIDSVDPLNPGLKARITQAENDIDAIELEQDNQDLTIQSNYNDINDPTTGLKQRVANLENTVITGETPIGTMQGSSLPTATQLTDYVVAEAHRQPKGGDYIYFILQVAGGTDKNYKYFYGVNGWSGAEIPPMEKAANDTLGIMQGTYGENKDTEVSIVNGKVDNIYVKDKSGTQKTLRNYLNTNETAIENNTNDINDPTTGLKTKVSTNTSNISTLTSEVDKIKNGTTVVPKSASAENDGLNRNIANTYMTQTSGATKQELKDYAMPRTFNDVSFVGANNVYTDTIPDTLSALYSVTSTQIGDTTLFYVDKTISNAEFELGNKNSYTTTLYLTANRDCSVSYRVTTQLYHDGAWTLLNAELTDVVDMVNGVMKKVNFGSPFNSMTDVIDVVSGDIIRQTFEVQTDFSTSTTFSAYSNATYPSTFYLNTTAQTIIVAQGYLGEIPYYSLNGVLNDDTITFDITAVLRENTLGMFKLNYASTIAEGTKLRLSYNGTSVRIITPYNYTTSDDATINDLYQVYQDSTGLLFKGFIKTIGGDLSVIADIDNLQIIIDALNNLAIDKQDKPTHITTVTDFNTFTTEGTYYLGAFTSSTSINAPYVDNNPSEGDVASTGVLEVYTRSNGTLLQLFKSISSDDDDDYYYGGQIFLRQRVYNVGNDDYSWENWRQIVTKDVNGIISYLFGTPTNGNDATNKKYVDDGLANKVDKTTTANQLYGTDANGNQTTYKKTLFHTSDYIQLRLNTAFQLSNGNDFQITDLRNAGFNIHNNSLIFDETNYDRVTIGAGVSVVKVTSVIQYLQRTDVTRFGNAVKKNGLDISNRGSYVGMCSDLTGTTLAAGQRRVVVTNSFICEVSQGDIFTFFGRSTGATSSFNDQITSEEAQTHFIIEVVK